MSRILDGKEISKTIRNEVAYKVNSLGSDIPVLAIVLATQDESATAYVRIIKKAAEKVGVSANILDLGENISHDKLLDTVKELAEDKNTHGIIIQTPVPAGIDIDEIRSSIPLEKDIDGANPLSAGRLFSGLPAFAPATAKAVIEILKHYQVELSGKNAVVIGRSRIVGKPVAHMLLDLNATVTICHSATVDLASFTQTADVLVVATGQVGLIDSEHLNPGKKTVVVDVGTNFNDAGRLVGDVDFKSVESLAGAITPVPGGVGPVTTAILLKNTLQACLSQTQNTP